MADVEKLRKAVQSLKNHHVYQNGCATDLATEEEVRQLRDAVIHSLELILEAFDG